MKVRGVFALSARARVDVVVVVCAHMCVMVVWRMCLVGGGSRVRVVCGGIGGVCLMCVVCGNGVCVVWWWWNG